MLTPLLATLATIAFGAATGIVARRAAAVRRPARLTAARTLPRVAHACGPST